MKKSLIALACAAMFTVNAAELRVDGPMELLKKEWSDGTMTGKNTHTAKIGGKLYKDVWEYWYVDSGFTPETIKLAPLKAVSPDTAAAKAWKGYTPILAAGISADGKHLHYPALLRNTMTIIHTRKSFGCAYGVRNPFDKDVVCYVEGRLWHNPEAKIYIYIQHKDGKVTKLVEDNNPDAVEEVSNKFPDGKVHVRHYMKLQVEAPMKPGDRLVIAGVRPDNQGKYVGKRPGLGTFRIDGWGKPWNPIISFEVP